MKRILLVFLTLIAISCAGFAQIVDEEYLWDAAFVVEWDAVTLDSYGNPITVDGYQVYVSPTGADTDAVQVGGTLVNSMTITPNARPDGPYYIGVRTLATIDGSQVPSAIAWSQMIESTTPYPTWRLIIQTIPALPAMPTGIRRR